MKVMFSQSLKGETFKMLLTEAHSKYRTQTTGSKTVHTGVFVAGQIQSKLGSKSKSRYLG